MVVRSRVSARACGTVVAIARHSAATIPLLVIQNLPSCDRFPAFKAKKYTRAVLPLSNVAPPDIGAAQPTRAHGPNRGYSDRQAGFDFVGLGGRAPSEPARRHVPSTLTAVQTPPLPS